MSTYRMTFTCDWDGEPKQETEQHTVKDFAEATQRVLDDLVSTAGKELWTPVLEKWFSSHTPDGDANVDYHLSDTEHLVYSYSHH